MNTGPRVPDFIRRQYDFAAHIRAPDQRPRPPDVQNRRMAVYRELFFNNVEGLLAANFPVTRQVLGDIRWRKLVRDFLVHHRCRTPHFPEVGQELIVYLRDRRNEQDEDPSFLAELAHYEWVELAVSIDDSDRYAPAADPGGNLLEGVPLISPLIRVLSYRYPVHRISPEFQPLKPEAEPTFIVVYRDGSDEVHFLEINRVTHRLLQLVKENGDRTGLDLLTVIADELQVPEPRALVTAGAALLTDLAARTILLGTRLA